MALLREYLIDELLPLWWEHGVDRERGGFWNALEPTLAPTDDDFKRLRVQARQLYVFSEGLRLGAGSFAREAADEAFAYLCDRYWDAARGGWRRTLSLDGAARDATLDTYDCAFVLLGLAAYLRETGETEAARALGRTLDVLDARLLDPGGLGYLSREGMADTRQQNPHMHLLEAFLLLHEVTGESTYRARAQGIVELFRWRLFQPDPGCIPETFDPDWSARPGPIEPGHQFEWSTLLGIYTRASPDAELARAAAALFGFGTRVGVDAERGGVWDEVERDGRVTRATKRLWPQLERVKALALRAETIPGGAAELDLARALEELFVRYRQPGHAGWYERLAADGEPLETRMPATSVYHVVSALAAALGSGVGLERKSP